MSLYIFNVAAGEGTKLVWGVIQGKGEALSLGGTAVR